MIKYANLSTPKQHTCMVFCDISKAFDRVWHKGLLFKLQQYGIKGDLLKWLENYLTDRKQLVSIRATNSDLKAITAGVPQGSVLGPLLLLIYVNDVTDNLLSIARLFADDSSLSSTSTNIGDLEGIINHDLNMLARWAKLWLVNFNPNKTEAMIFTLRQTDRPIQLFFDGTAITLVENHKHLGLTLSNNGKWHTHINNLMSSASRLLGIMKKLKFQLSRKSLNQIYISYVRPLIEYASVVWDNCSQYEKNMIDQIQNEAARIVTGLTRSVHLENLRQEVGWQSLSTRREVQKLSIMYKAKNNLAPNYINTLIPPTVNTITNYNLRNINDIEIPRTRLEGYRLSFIPASVGLWNRTEPVVRNLGFI